MEYMARTSSDSSERQQQNAQLNVAKAIAQLIACLLLEKSALRHHSQRRSTGFTYFDDADLDTLYYHFADPNDADAPDGLEPHLSPVGILLGFIEASWGKMTTSDEASQRYQRRLWPTRAEVKNQIPLTPVAPPRLKIETPTPKAFYPGASQKPRSIGKGKGERADRHSSQRKKNPASSPPEELQVRSSSEA
jgi:hypothetical protein